MRVPVQHRPMYRRGTVQVRQEGRVHVEAAVAGVGEDTGRDQEAEGDGDDEVDGAGWRP